MRTLLLPPWIRAVVLVVLLPGAAAAQSTSVKELFDNGQIHFDSGQYDLALEAWNEAYAQSGRAILLLKMADAHEAAREFADAVERLEQYRESASEAELPSITMRIEALRTMALETTTPPEPEPDPEPTPDPAPDPDPDPDPAPAAPHRSIALDLTLGGATAIGIGVGTASGLTALSARRSALESCAGPTGGLVCTSQADSALARDRTASTVADIGFVVGGAAAVAWTVTALTRSRSSDLQVALGPTSATLIWRPR